MENQLITEKARENLDDDLELVRKEKLHPVKAAEKSTLFLKSEVLKRNWQ